MKFYCQHIIIAPSKTTSIRHRMDPDGPQYNIFPLALVHDYPLPLKGVIASPQTNLAINPQVVNGSHRCPNPTRAQPRCWRELASVCSRRRARAARARPRTSPSTSCRPAAVCCICICIRALLAVSLPSL